jgi:hypothetical protein
MRIFTAFEDRRDALFGVSGCVLQSKASSFSFDPLVTGSMEKELVLCSRLAQGVVRVTRPQPRLEGSLKSRWRSGLLDSPRRCQVDAMSKTLL